MAIDAGTNCLTKAEDAIRTMLANSTAFRAFVGAADEAEALTKIHIDDFPRPAEDDEDTYTAAEWAAFFPCVLIEPPDSGEAVAFTLLANSGLQWDYSIDSAFQLRFEKYQETDDDDDVESRKFKNAVGDILDELTTMSGTSGYYGFTRLAPLAKPYRGNYSHAQALGEVHGWVIGIERTSGNAN